ncbi:MAG: hypothetical protein ABFD60_01505 [Bryobacteraceae bacterium]
MAPLLHPDDVLLFHEIAAAMRQVSKRYNLKLHDVAPHPQPEYATAPLGDCSIDGHIRLVMRGMTAGKWDDEPRREQDVWNTAAHELAHLRHFNHGIQFQEFETELIEAMNNRKLDHREKVLARLVKMQASKEGEAAIGNLEASEAFAAAINRMLIEYELNPSDIDYARTTDHDPVVEITVNLDLHGIEKKRSRIAWQETLARVVAKAHLCSFLIHTGSNHITFVGTKSHATVAEYVYSMLVPITAKMACYDYHKYQRQVFSAGEAWKIHGFSGSWYLAFTQRIAERFNEAREAAVAAAAPDVPGSQSTAMVRLDGALVKVQDYIDNKFGKKRRYASAIGVSGDHTAGRAAGRAAADAMVIGRKGVTGGHSAGRLGSGL